MMIWYNGDIMDTVHISPMDRGFTLGDGAFSTLYYAQGKVEHFSDHMHRLRRTLDVLSITFTYSDETILEAIKNIAQHNTVDTGAVRITISRGAGGRGLLFPQEPTPTVIITISNITRYREPAKLTIADGHTRNETDILSKYKISAYASPIIAFNNAVELGFDDCVILNTKGYVCCTSIANIFGIKGDMVITPDLEQGCLDGVYRKNIIQYMQSHDINIECMSMSISDMKQMDAVFMTNSIIGVRVVDSLDEIQYDIHNTILQKVKVYVQDVQ